MFKNILVPTDGSELSGRAIKRAVILAKEQKARVTALHVTPPYELPGGEDAATYRYVTPQQHAAGAAAVSRRHLGAVEREASRAGVACDSVHATSRFPFDEIVRTASRRKCDLICMASHGRTGLSRLLLGSQTSKVLALSKVPVMVVR